jgi:acetolactate synthase I/II/III large subunit
MRVAERIADWLSRHKIDQVFTVTGGGAMFLNQALGGHVGMRCTFMHHEQACAMAAEGYARIAGKPAVVMLTTGPGAINALNGVFGAYTDSIPMIVVSGQVKRETCLSFHDLPDLRQLGDQEGPTIALARHMCKYAHLIQSPAELENALPEAYRLAVSGRPGPVWLDIPIDIQSSTEEIVIPDIELANSVGIASVDAACEELFARLKTAHRPVILGGTGVRLADAKDALLRLVERTGIPLATAWTHDLIGSDHPLFAGRPGTIGTRAGNFCLQNADFVLVLGSRLNIRQTSYNWHSFARNAFVVQVDIDRAELGKPTVAPDLGIEADVGNFLAVLERKLDRDALPNFSTWADWVRGIGQKYDVTVGHVQKAGGPLNPYLVVKRIFEHLRNDDIVVCGNASACILPFQIGTLREGQRMFSNSGSASMGFDLPAAIGAAQADGCARQRRVICFAGDGSLQMNIQELQTLKTLGLNVIVIVLNNDGYLSIRQTHENFFGRVIGANPASGVEFPDFAQVANAYRLKSVRITSEVDLGALEALLGEDGPIVIDILVDPEQEFAPRMKSRVDESGKIVTPELDDMFPFLNPDEIRSVRESALQIRSITP